VRVAKLRGVSTWRGLSSITPHAQEGGDSHPLKKVFLQVQSFVLVKAFVTCFVGSCLKQLRIIKGKYAKVIRARSTEVRGCRGQ
jgi:hypothetical protein